METRSSVATRSRVRTIRGALRRALAAIGIAAIALTGAVITAPAAQAASPGVGLGDWGDSVYGYFGSFTAPDGTRIFCYQPGVPLPTGTSSGPILANPGEYGLPSDPNRVAGMNHVITEWGNTNDPVTAMAVMKATQALATDLPTTIGGYGYGDAGYPFGMTWAGLAQWVYPSGNPLTPAQRAQFVAEVEVMYAAGLATVAGGGSTTASGNLDFAIVGTTGYQGTVTPNTTAPGSTGTITLTNAIFDATGTSTMTGAVSGTAYAFTGTPPNPEWDASDYTVDGTATFTTGGDGYSPNLTVWTTPGQQSSAGAGTRSTTEFTFGGADPAAFGVGFRPTVTTQVSTVFLEDGDVPADELLFGTQADEDGINRPWFQSSSGRYAPISAEGTLYGPTTSQPTQSATVPANAEIAGTASVTTDPASDPTAVPTVAESDRPVTESGFYTWVWTVSYDMQRESVRELLPIGYSYSHDYGLVPETSIRAMSIDAVSQVTVEEAALGAPVGDTLTVAAPSNGNWVEVEGGRVPVTYRSSAYFVTEEPVQGETVPADAELLSTQTYTTNRPGTIEAEPVTAPIAEGWVVFVWTVNDADQATPGYVDEWSDGWATPGEVAKISPPTVTTNAQAGAKLGAPIFDVATVEGLIPAQPTTLSFEAFQVPVVKDAETDEWVVDAPEGTEPGDLSWVCDAEPVFVTENPQTIAEAGEYTSEPFTPSDYAKLFWVETLTTTPEGGDPVVVHRGECAVAEESSVIVDVTTRAQTTNGDQTVDNGEQAFDTVLLNGFVPNGATVTVTGYRAAADVPVTEACNEDRAVYTWTSEELTGGLVENLEIDSAKFTPPPLGTDSKLYFIETTKDALGRTVSTGECGEPSETLAVTGDGTIAWTGGDATPALWVGSFALMALFTASALYVTRRRVTA